MKRTSVFALVIGMSLVMGVSAQGLPFQEALEEVRALKLQRALASAHKQMLRAKLSTRDKNVVLSERRGFVVVSFLTTRQGYGGRTHLVYDPKLERIVYTIGED